jgi:hypothetical protein
LLDNLAEDITKRMKAGFKDPPSIDLSKHTEEAYRDNKASLRMSNVGSICYRKLWYDINDPIKLSPELRNIFMAGDIWEEVMLQYIREAGYSVSHEQHEVELAGIKGHIDCVVDGCLVDIKTASSYHKFETLETNDPYGYLPQQACYLECMKDVLKDKEHVYFVVYNKTYFTVRVFKYNVAGLASGMAGYIMGVRSVLSSKPEIPDILVRKDKLPEIINSTCLYCDRLIECRGVKKVYETRNGKRRYYIHPPDRPPKTKSPSGRMVDCKDVTHEQT